MKICGILAAILALALAGGARADDPAAARAHYEKGTTLYDLGQYREAAHEYEAAYRAKSDPALLFNIGQAYRFAGDNASAVRSYRAYLRRAPSASNRAEVEGYIVRLQKLIEEQKSTSTSPPTGTLSPGETRGPSEPATRLEATRAAPPERTPVYKKWWLWTAVGGAIVVGAAVALAVVYTTPNDAPAPANAVTVTFP